MSVSGRRRQRSVTTQAAANDSIRHSVMSVSGRRRQRSVTMQAAANDSIDSAS